MCRNKKTRRVVAKFGGKSPADGGRIHRAARAVAREVEGSVHIAVVASVLGNCGTVPSGMPLAASSSTPSY